MNTKNSSKNSFVKGIFKKIQGLSTFLKVIVYPSIAGLLFWGFTYALSLMNVADDFAVIAGFALVVLFVYLSCHLAISLWQEISSSKEDGKQESSTKSTLQSTLLIVGLAAMSMTNSSCKRIDAGHVGIKVKQTGSDKGVQDITEVTGWVFYSPLSYSVYEFPTFVQHKEYTAENSFVVNSKDGSEFHVSPVINYSVQGEKVVDIFKKYRRGLADIEDQFLKTAVYDAFRLVANGYTADSLISSRESFEVKIKKTLTEHLTSEGFVIQQFTSNLSYPETFKASIEAKNAAVQKALQADNEVKTAEAQAKIKVAQIQGQADALRIQADADAYANKVRQSSLTPMLVQQQFIEKWDGKLPTYGTVPQLFKDITK